VDVVFVRWPQEAARRDRLAMAGIPRLLLVDDGTRPPDPVDCLEDWTRIPTDDADIRARADAIARRAALHASPLPAVDEDGVLRYGTRWTSLPPVEARLTEALVDRFGSVVSRDMLAGAGWPEGAPGRNALDVHVLRLRRRLSPVGLAIRTVRSRGYLLEAAELHMVREA
jgi:two-component system OmpR family response regulator